MSNTGNNMEEELVNRSGSNPFEVGSQNDLENRERFFKRLEEFLPEEIDLISFAYDISKEAHRPQVRETGERYFEHLRRTSIILIDECEAKDPNIIAASLLHDVVEDSYIFGSIRSGYVDWKTTARHRLTRMFNEEVAEIVFAVTKPKADGDRITSKEQADELYISNLRVAHPEAIIVKMADRLDNLRTLGTLPEVKKRRIVEDTKKYYLPLFKVIEKKYPKYYQKLFSEISSQLDLLSV